MRKKNKKTDSLSGIILLCTCKESLGEEKSGNPENWRRTVVVPVCQKFKTGNEVIDVAAERLQGWVRFLHPHAWDLTLQDGQTDLL